MNKILKIAIVVVLCLIVLLTIALFVFQSDDNGDSTTTTTTTTPTTTTTTTSSTSGNTNPDPDPDPDPCTEHVDENEDNKCDNCNADMPNSDYTETNDKVYVITQGLNLRKDPEVKEGNALGWAEQDTELDRLGYYKNGWSKIRLEDGTECYAYTELLTTEKPITDFTAKSEMVYLTKNAYAFTKPSHLEAEGYSVADYILTTGQIVKRTGVANEVYVGEDGTEYTFARVEFDVVVDGKQETIVRYVNNAYLSEIKPTGTNPDGSIEFFGSHDKLEILVEKINLRSTTAYDKETGSPENVAVTLHNKAGTVLQAVSRGVESSDGTIWYKVQYGDEIYYVIYNTSNLKIQLPE